MAKCRRCSRETNRSTDLCSNCDDDDSFTNSMIIGAATNSALIGMALGGSFSGGLMGDAMNGGFGD